MEKAKWDVPQIAMREAIRSSWEIYVENLRAVVVASLIVLLPGTILYVVLPESFTFPTLDLLNFAAGAWIAGAMVRVVIDFEGDGRDELPALNLLASAWPRLLSLVLLGIFSGIAIFAGTLLLIVPGVYLILIWMVSVPAMIVEGKGVFASMSRSASMTRYRRLDLLAFPVMAIAVGIPVVAVSFLLEPTSTLLDAAVGLAATAFLYPYLSILAADIYFRLIEANDATSE